MGPDNLPNNVTGLILSGGQGKRMDGQDKGLLMYNGRPMIQTVLDVLSQKLDHIIINANRNIETYQSFGYPVVIDAEDNYSGPLAGIQSGLEAIHTPYAFVVPCDAPLLNIEVLHQLYNAIHGHSFDIAVATVEERLEPVFMLIRKTMHRSIRIYLDSGSRKTADWINRQNIIATDFTSNPEWFVNINTQNDIAGDPL